MDQLWEDLVNVWAFLLCERMSGLKLNANPDEGAPLGLEPLHINEMKLIGARIS